MAIKNINYNKIYYTDSINGDDTHGDGSKLKPFKTLTIALSKCETNDAIFIKGIHEVNSMSFLNKDICIIGNYFKFNSTIKGSINNFKGCIYNIYFENLTTSAWGETFSYCNIKLYNCIFNETAGNSNVYGNYEFNNCVILNNGECYTETVFNNCAFKKNLINGKIKLNNCLTECIFNEKFNILNKDWKHLGSGINKDGSTANIGIYGGELDFLNKFFILLNEGKYYNLKKDIIELNDFKNEATYFIKNGFNYFNIEKIKEKFKDLNSITILMWSDESISTLNYSLNKPFKPIDKFKGKIELLRQTEK